MSRFAIRIVVPATALTLAAGAIIATVAASSAGASPAPASAAASTPVAAPSPVSPDSWTVILPTLAPSSAGGATPTPAPTPTHATPSPTATAPAVPPRQPAGATTQGAAHQVQPSTAQRPTPAPSSSGSAPGSSAASNEPPASTEFQTEVLRLINQYRAQAGLSALTIDSRLTAAAEEQASYQASIETGTHTDAQGGNGGQRITAQGYSWCSWGENAAWNYETPEDVVTAWMASPDHKANILKARFTNMGLATARGADGVVYWTQDFGCHC